MKKEVLKLLTALTMPLLIISCNGNKEKTNSNESLSSSIEQNQTTENNTVSKPSPAVKFDKAPEQVVSGENLIIHADDQMKFLATELKVPKGKKIKLTLYNVGVQIKESMGHNVVILKEGTDFNDFCNKSIGAASNNYVAPTEIDKVIAYTALTGGGESAETEFTVNKAGKYPFVCSFPGHHMNMNGNIIVE